MYVWKDAPGQVSSEKCTLEPQWGITALPLEWAKDVEQQEFLITASGNTK